MCKKSFVALVRGNRKYKLYSEDIAQVHKAISKMRPALPKFDEATEVEVENPKSNTPDSAITI